ncbi:Hypothetical protein SRAE_X000006900 [Strongyloides ratti]|uniref:TRAM/LAG1/CLN8 homology domain-containing protein n=1 Tax=Strongyloides ratti TaxID=34506 RepID=A0A090N0I3_STRRB|nr:Hypothetical protein SRAE_X000006900 [Strongyloides ratti]CEF70738.1 Hypothetical protein SRAE_X000006900 [Strongyloides ratti]
MTGIRFVITSYMHVWLYEHINILDELSTHGYNILQQILVISFVTCYEFLEIPSKNNYFLCALYFLSILISIDFIHFYKNVANLGERNFTKVTFLHIFHGILAKSTGYRLAKIVDSSFFDSEESDSDSFLNGVLVDRFHFRVIEANGLVNNESDNENFDEEGSLKDSAFDSSSSSND